MLEGRAYFDGQNLTMELAGIVNGLAMDVDAQTSAALQQAGMRQIVPPALSNILLRLLEVEAISHCRIQGNRVTLTIATTKTVTGESNS